MIQKSTPRRLTDLYAPADVVKRNAALPGTAEAASLPKSVWVPNGSGVAETVVQGPMGVGRLASAARGSSTLHRLMVCVLPNA
jgi:hypothetical protein